MGRHPGFVLGFYFPNYIRVDAVAFFARTVLKAVVNTGGVELISHTPFLVTLMDVATSFGGGVFLRFCDSTIFQAKVWSRQMPFT